VAFSLYSRIPMPIFEWKEEDMKHNLVFLPWIGGCIGLVCLGMYFLFSRFMIPVLAQVCLYTAMPILITGGFHLDGFMDVQDAKQSFKSKEEKLEILKDPHIGAFAVIRLALFGLVWIASLTVLCEGNQKILFVGFMLFFFVRCISSILSLTLKHAKKSGMLHMETEKSTKWDVAWEVLQAVLVVGLMAYLHWISAVVCCLVAVTYAFCYKSFCYKEFGGITGDTTGYSIAMMEEWILVALSVLSVMENSGLL